MDRQAAFEVLLDHFEYPRQHGALADADVVYRGQIAGCADTVTIYLKVTADDRVGEATFQGDGCAISQAGASVVTELAIGRSLDALLAMTVDALAEEVGWDVLVSRPRCASLGLEALKGAIREYRRVAATDPRPAVEPSAVPANAWTRDDDELLLLDELEEDDFAPEGDDDDTVM